MTLSNLMLYGISGARWICTNRAHLGHNEVSLVNRGGVPTSGVAFRPSKLDY